MKCFCTSPYDKQTHKSEKWKKGRVIDFDENDSEKSATKTAGPKATWQVL
jgi:hypothetical protein